MVKVTINISHAVGELYSASHVSPDGRAAFITTLSPFKQTILELHVLENHSTPQTGRELF